MNSRFLRSSFVPTVYFGADKVRIGNDIDKLDIKALRVSN